MYYVYKHKYKALKNKKKMLSLQDKIRFHLIRNVRDKRKKGKELKLRPVHISPKLFNKCFFFMNVSFRSLLHFGNSIRYGMNDLENGDVSSFTLNKIKHKAKHVSFIGNERKIVSFTVDDCFYLIFVRILIIIEKYFYFIYA